MKKIVSIFIIGFLIIGSFGVQGLFFDKTSDKTINKVIKDILFDKKIEFFMKLAKFPSLSTCIIEGDEVIWTKEYGYYDLDNKKPATENTIYNIAQVTKSVTGTALMQLWEQGLFELDEDVNNYLPFSLRNPHFPDDAITFRMLLSHSSSLRDDIPINDIFGRSISYDWVNFSGDPPFSFFPHPWLEKHLIPSGKFYNPAHWSNSYKPGEFSFYSHVNFAIIAYLIERISGEIFIEYCKKHIFLPLEMYHTSFNLSEFDIDDVAIPYHFHKESGEYLQINELSIDGKIHPGKYWKILNYPAGGLYSTVSDLSHFLIAHVNEGVYKGVRILKKETIDEMHRIQLPGNFNPMIQAYYGLAWLFKINPLIFNITLMGHYGLSIGVATIMYHIPTENIRVIFMVNGDGLSGNTMAVNMIEINLFKKGGLNLLSYIDFTKIGR
jgi:CubicO group peptidase (beta-lactamase class C family)